MLYKKQPLILLAILVACSAQLTPMTYDRSARMKARGLVRHVRRIDPNKSTLEILKEVDFGKLFKDLHQYLSPDEVRMVTTLGFVTGTLRAEGKSSSMCALYRFEF